MNIQEATARYEAWLRQQIPLLPADVRLKHRRMAESPFPFLRATFYRWAQLWPRICPELARAPRVLGVGDLHAENFGTWRDTEGRLIWGVNDFDEVAPMPYTNDLVRLAASASLAIRENDLSCNSASACEAMLIGYKECIKKGGEPFVLAERHGWLREMATNKLRDPTAFWQKLTGLPSVRTAVPPAIKSILREALPEKNLAFRIVHRQAGLGSLGRRRFTALAFWDGGWIAREAKELRASAWLWPASSSEKSILYQKAIKQAIRVPDPYVFVRGHWLIRRLAPYCSRIELSSLPKTKDELKLFHAMGWETANIHLGTKWAIREIIKHLRKQPANWLRRATQAMTKTIIADWKMWAGRSG
ncbi:MAG: hypothetical protein C5B50_09935 [Verrucomicrobia bacterium]|nr:MAG: hypothetical protein C5B50_09935 [Verrucomicrobiota bacterium]